MADMEELLQETVLIRLDNVLKASRQDPKILKPNSEN
jgi:hypothetical protein